MTRKRPTFVKECSSSEDDYEEHSDNNLEDCNSDKDSEFDFEPEIKIKKDEKSTAKVTKKSKKKRGDIDESVEFEMTMTEDLILADESFESMYASNSSLQRDDAVLELNKYWPQGLEREGTETETIPEDQNLLLLYSRDIANELPDLCPYCNDEKFYKELNVFIAHKENGHDFQASLAEFNQAFAKHCKKAGQEPPHYPKLNCLIQPKCCSKAKVTNCDELIGNLSRSPLVKYFACGKKIIVYLKIDPDSIPLIPRNIDKVIKDRLDEKYHMNNLNKWKVKVIDKVSDFSDTFDFPEAEIPEGFKMNLRSYQLRSISWMREIEAIKITDSNTIHNNFIIGRVNPDESYIKLKLGHTPYYLAFNGSKAITKSPGTTKFPPLRFYGGVLADDTGSGKTVTTFGLIHSAPLTKEKYEERYKRFHNLSNYSQSRATLILCPSNIYKQWMSEAKKCNPNFKIYGFSTILDHRKVSIQDIIQADVVVVSYAFLVNSSYLCSKSGDCVPAHFSFNPHIEGSVCLRRIHYHRIILDEFHEVESKNHRSLGYIKSLQADYVWGLTGTPHKDILFDLLNYTDDTERIREVCQSNFWMKNEFYFKHVKRNVPNLELPPIETETIWINLNPNEMVMLRMEQKRSIKEEIMMCSHYQLNEKRAVSVEEFMSIEEVQSKMAHNKEREINHVKQDIASLQAKIELFKSEPEKHKREITACEEVRRASERKLASIQSSYNYFKSVFRMIAEPDRNECSICYDTIPAELLSILPCSHMYCFDCIKQATERSKLCPICKSFFEPKNIFRIRIQEPEAPILGNIDTSKYSTKLVALYHYMTDLIEREPDSRIILFLQFKDLAEFIGNSLKTLGIEYVRVTGNVFQRQNAISKFRDSKSVRLIMLSSEDSVSGINLTQATHIILLHPFYTGSGENTDLAYEKQGISRAYRFGLQHPLKIVRFAAVGTVEESITLRREKIKLSN